MSEAFSGLLVNCGLFLLLTLIGVVLAGGRVRRSWLAVAFGLFILHDAVSTGGWGYLALPDLAPGPHPWATSIVSTVVLLIVGALMFDGRWRLTGVTVMQRGPSPVSALVVTALVAAAFAGAAWYLVPGRVGPLADLAYKASLPAIEQELLYRGFLLAALDRAFGTPVRIRGAPMGWGAVASATLFAADRALSMSPDLVLSAAFDAGAWVFLAGMLLVWLRAASGSILLPVLVHSWAVASFYVL